MVDTNTIVPLHFYLFPFQHRVVSQLCELSATSQLHELFFIIVKSGNDYNKKVYIKMSYTSLVMDYCVGFSIFLALLVN